jgi:hypothetical protein
MQSHPEGYDRSGRRRCVNGRDLNHLLKPLHRRIQPKPGYFFTSLQIMSSTNQSQNFNLEHYDFVTMS